MLGVGSEKQSMGKIMEHRRKYQERARGWWREIFRYR
jgi:hypothetical protein